MDALDLTLGPPRSPRAKLADLDLLMAARTVDKLRATLPGGNLGSYKMAGFSLRLLEALEIREETLRDVIARANSEDEIAAWIRANSDANAYAQINAVLEQRIIAHYLDDSGFFERYPVAKRLSPELPLIDLLIEDDRELFNPAHRSDGSRV
jgi:Domain of unknown function (DUF5069)